MVVKLKDIKFIYGNREDSPGYKLTFFPKKKICKLESFDIKETKNKNETLICLRKKKLGFFSIP